MCIVAGLVELGGRLCHLATEYNLYLKNQVVVILWLQGHCVHFEILRMARHDVD